MTNLPVRGIAIMHCSDTIKAIQDEGDRSKHFNCRNGNGYGFYRWIPSYLRKGYEEEQDI